MVKELYPLFPISIIIKDCRYTGDFIWINDLNIEVNTREVVERFCSDSQRIYFLFSVSSLQSHERVNK